MEKQEFMAELATDAINGLMFFTDKVDKDYGSQSKQHRLLVNGGTRPIYKFIRGKTPKISMQKLCYWNIKATINLYIDVCCALCCYCTHTTCGFRKDISQAGIVETTDNIIESMRVLFDTYLYTTKDFSPGDLIYGGSKSDHLSPNVTDVEIQAMIDFIASYDVLNFVIFTKFPDRLVNKKGKLNFSIPANLAIVATVETDLEQYTRTLSLLKDKDITTGCKLPSAPHVRIKAIKNLRVNNVTAGFGISPAIDSSTKFVKKLAAADPDIVILGSVNNSEGKIKTMEADWIQKFPELGYRIPQILGARKVVFPWLTAEKGNILIDDLKTQIGEDKLYLLPSAGREFNLLGHRKINEIISPKPYNKRVHAKFTIPNQTLNGNIIQNALNGRR